MERIFEWTSRTTVLSLALLLVASVWGAAMWSRLQQVGDRVGATKARLNEVYGQLPLSFEANAGQTDPQVDFISHGSSFTLFLTPREAVLALRATSSSATTGDRRNDSESDAEAVLRMKFVDSETELRAAGHDELPGKVNYFIGNDPRRWRTGISTYAKVVYKNLYPGVDLVYYGNQRQLEYDFIVRPGANPDVIALRFEGAGQLEVDAQGELVLQAGGGEIRQRKPLIYQEVDGVRHEVAGSYKLKDRDTVGFELSNYDTSRPLVIDPVLVYSTFLGNGAEDAGLDITVDTLGNAYVVGYTLSNFPTTVGAFDTTQNGSRDAFVTKLNPSGSALVYSTFLGGFGQDIGRGIAVDSSGSAFVTGLTSSTNFPTTVGSLDTTHNGGLFDAFVTKLDPAGSALVYSTFLGGVEFDGGNDIAVDTSGDAYVAGHTESNSFPTTAGAFDTTHSPDENLDVFVTKLNSAGSALVYSTFLGGSNGALAPGIAVDTSGSAYVTGTTSSVDFPTTIGAFDTTPDGSSDVFVTKFNQAGSALVYSTVLGDSGLESSDNIAIDTSGSAYVAGTTSSPNFPTTVGAFDTTYNGGRFDAFVTKLNPAGSALVYSTFLGGVDVDAGEAIAVDTSGSVYVAGTTSSSDFPTTVGAFDTMHNGGMFDAFVTKLNPSGATPLVYSTFLGGSSDDEGIGIAVDILGSAYVTGLTLSPEFPTTVGSFDSTANGDSDAYVVKLSTVGGLPATLTLNPLAATNPIDSQHCVTATVQDALGDAVSDLVVRFQVIGSVSTSGSATTDPNGEASFCYFGPPLPGADTIKVYTDTNNNDVQDTGEPSGMATKTWVLPVTTPLCEITNGGWTIAENGDRASFGGKATANESSETQGHQEYLDHGPVLRLKMRSINVLAIVCDGSTRASIFGQATINGSGVVNYRINVQDLGEPGRGQDTYRLLMEGYDSGEQKLRGGNVQIRRK